MTDVNPYRYYPPTLPRLVTAETHGDQILALWRADRNTYDIALQLGIPEFQVANMLPQLLERRRKNAEWNFDTLNAAVSS